MPKSDESRALVLPGNKLPSSTILQRMSRFDWRFNSLVRVRVIHFNYLIKKPLVWCRIVLKWFSWTHCDRHNNRASGGVLRHPGDVILRCEPGDVVVGIQQVDHNVGCGAEPLRSVNLHGQQLPKWGENFFNFFFYVYFMNVYPVLMSQKRNSGSPGRPADSNKSAD